MYILFFGQIETVLAASTVRESCREARIISIVSTPADLQKAICNIQIKYPTSEKINFLTNQIISIAGKLDPASQWQSDSALESSLQSLSESMTQQSPKNDVALNTPLSEALKKLISKWGDLKARTSNQKEYIKDFNKVLQSTKTGREVLDCYAKAQGPLISGEQFVLISKEEEDQGIGMAFNIIDDPKHPGKYIKTIIFNPKLPPINGLMLYAHEMKHGCQSAIVSQNMNRFEKLEKGTNEWDAHLKEINQTMAVDEMRAYSLSVKLFKELAKSAPQLVCNTYSIGSLFGKQITSSGDYSANLDEMFEEGTFPLYLISTYTSMGFYKPENILNTDKNGLPINELRSDLIKKIEAEGFYVKK